MSSDSFDATIDLAPRASLRALTLLMLLHGTVGMLLLLAQPPGWLMGSGVAAVGMSWLYLRRHPAFGFGEKALTRLTWHAEGGWTLHEAGGASVGASLEGSSIVLPGLLILNFLGADGASRHRALLGDELDVETFKRLRARLRLV